MSIVGLDSLDPEQRAVAEAVRGRVVVIAAAGSGKTRAITHRIAHACATGAQNPAQGLALSFTTRAANELKGRVGALGVDGITAATFHATALRQLNHFWSEVFGGPSFKVTNQRSSLIESVGKSEQLSASGWRTVVSEIDWAKASGLDPATYGELERVVDDVDVKTIAELWGRYEDLCHTKRIIDFDDVLSLTVGMLSSRPDVLTKVRARYSWFTVDEFQDITPLQNVLLNLWVGDREELCVVGDPSQTIYSFAGAESDYLTKFASDYPQSTFVQLMRTYRCPPTVVAAANSLMNSQLPMVSEKTEAGQLSVVSYADEVSEAQDIAQRISTLIARGVDPRDICVLVRINSMTEVIERAFEMADVPFTVRGGQNFFNRPEIKQALLRLRATSYVNDQMNVRSAVDEVITDLGWADSVSQSRNKEVWESLSALRSIAYDCEGGFIEFFETVAQRTMAQDHPQAQAVTITTLHSAKGLEWPHVFIPSINEGLLPFHQQTSDEAIEEERRLLYVGITRASDSAFLSHTTTRFGQSAQASRFLSQLSSPVTAVAVSHIRKAEPEKSLQTSVCANCGGGLLDSLEVALGVCDNCPRPRNEVLEKSLSKWREDISAELVTIPWLILSDVTIAALAFKRPQTREQLRGIAGMRDSKVEQFGDDLLSLLAQN